MVYRKGEFQPSRLDREYLFHVALPTPKGVPNFHEVDEFVRTFGGAPRHHSVGEWAIHHTIFCFKEERYAAEFLDRFGGFSIEPNAKARKVLLAELRARPKIHDYG
ncbi:hypothetical protein ACETRX_02960 [Labrys portucalensis]|uniref:Uncharacterized protein n=1 Tax=Labrys neptuniae TaxID=376174 RepID=A0ABV6Z8P0_9HYPH